MPPAADPSPRKPKIFTQNAQEVIDNNSVLCYDVKGKGKGHGTQRTGTEKPENAAFLRDMGACVRIIYILRTLLVLLVQEVKDGKTWKTLL